MLFWIITSFTIAVVFVYTWTRLMIMYKFDNKTPRLFLALMWHRNTMTFWSIDSSETWRQFCKVKKYYRSKHYMDGIRVGRVRWWAEFLNNIAIKN